MTKMQQIERNAAMHTAKTIARQCLELFVLASLVVVPVGLYFIGH